LLHVNKNDFDSVVTEKDERVKLQNTQVLTMDIGEDSWEHVPPLLLNCGQEDSNVGGGHEEYLHNTEEVSDCISLMTARSACAHALFLTAVELDLSDEMQVVCLT